jgi:hypothetical protein
MFHRSLIALFLVALMLSWGLTVSAQESDGLRTVDTTIVLFDENNQTFTIQVTNPNADDSRSQDPRLVARITPAGFYNVTATFSNGLVQQGWSARNLNGVWVEDSSPFIELEACEEQGGKRILDSEGILVCYLPVAEAPFELIANTPVSRTPLTWSHYDEFGLRMYMWLTEYAASGIFFADSFAYRAFDHNGQIHITSGDGTIWRVPESNVSSVGETIRFSYPYPEIHIPEVEAEIDGDFLVFDSPFDGYWRIPMTAIHSEEFTNSDNQVITTYYAQYPGGEVWEVDANQVTSTTVSTNSGEQLTWSIKVNGEEWQIPDRIGTEQKAYKLINFTEDWCEAWEVLMGEAGCRTAEPRRLLRDMSYDVDGNLTALATLIDDFNHHTYQTVVWNSAGEIISRTDSESPSRWYVPLETDTIVYQKPNPDINDTELFYRSEPGGELVQITDLPRGSWALLDEISPSGSEVAILIQDYGADYFRRVEIHTLDGSPLINPTQIFWGAIEMEWSVSGAIAVAYLDCIVSSDGCTAVRLEVPANNFARTITGSTSTMALSPDASRLAVAVLEDWDQMTTNFLVFDTKTGEAITLERP